MILRSAALVLLIAAPAAFATGYWSGQGRTVRTPVTAARINAPLVVRPGAGAAGAGKYLAALNAPPPPPPPAPVPAAARPTPPDVAVLFRGELSAVVTNGEPYVLLAGGRKLKAGEVYRDGWKVSGFNSQSAVLAKGKETRNVNLFGPVSSSGAQNALRPVQEQPFTRISLTNGVKPGELTEAQIKGVLDAMKAAGADQRQLDQLKRSLENGGQMNQQQVMQMLMNLSSNGKQMTPAQMNNVIQSLVRAGLVQPNQATQLAQILPQILQNQQLQGLIGGGGFRGDGGGGGGGRNRGGGGALGGFLGGAGGGGNGRGAGVNIRQLPQGAPVIQIAPSPQPSSDQTVEVATIDYVGAD